MVHDKPVVEPTGAGLVEHGALLLLRGLQQELGLDITTANFTETPKRIAKAYLEILSGVKNKDAQIKAALSKSFPSMNRGLVVQQGIKVFSLCPHHFLPVEYDVTIAYVPKNDVVGLSKLARVAEIEARQPILHEDFVRNVSLDLFRGLHARGAACHAVGRHFCMAMRGVGQHGATTVSNYGIGDLDPELNPVNWREFLTYTKY